MTELRERFIKHLTLQRFSPKTQEAYINAVKGLAGYYRQSSDQLSNDQIQVSCLNFVVKFSTPRSQAPAWERGTVFTTKFK